jgi:hypothetical protein
MEVLNLDKVTRGEPHKTKEDSPIDIGIAVSGNSKTIIIQEKGQN